MSIINIICNQLGIFYFLVFCLCFPVPEHGLCEVGVHPVLLLHVQLTVLVLVEDQANRIFNCHVRKRSEDLLQTRLTYREFADVALHLSFL